jgi:predicted phosphodiesterase
VPRALEIQDLVTTFFGDARTTRAFTWRTPYCDGETEIQYAKADGFTGFEAADVVKKSASRETSDGEYHKVVLEGLEPGTTYKYRVGSTADDVWSDTYSFTTESESVTSFTFIGVSDPQGINETDYSYYKLTLDSAFNAYPDAEFVINCGDMVDTGTSDEQGSMFFDASLPYSAERPLMTVIGNHETRGDGVNKYRLHFNNPQNAVGLGIYDSNDPNVTLASLYNTDNTVYSFDYGNAHFAVLNTGSDWYDMTELLNMQKQWLINDLNATDKKWKILVLHRGVYTSYYSHDDVRNAYLEIIDTAEVDLVLQGHEHLYMRTYPMRRNEVATTEKYEISKGVGTVYSIIGVAAQKRYNFVDRTWSASAYNIPTGNPSYIAVTVDDDQISFAARLSDGTTIDSFTITDD